MADQPRVLAARYRFLSVLGRGGMGQVWLAEDEVLGRQVAVKEIRFPSDLPADERGVLVERTLREARLTARLTHPGIITVFDVVLEDGRPYIVMELVRAPSLAAALDMEGRLPPQRVAQIGLRLLDALDVAHEAGVVHRDVKPSNVLLDGDRVVLSDFGIARSSSDATLTTTGMVVGSPTYMSPERLRSEGVGPGGDMWSLGATLYAALEGHPPFRAQNVMGTITAVLADPPDPPAVGGAMRAAVMGLLEKDPESRLSSEQVRLLLEQALDEPARTTEAPPVEDPRRSGELPVMAPAVDQPAAVAGGWYDTPAPQQRPQPAAHPTPHPTGQSTGQSTGQPAARPAAQPALKPAADLPSGEPTTRDADRPARPGRRSIAAALVVFVAVVTAVTVMLVRSGDNGSASAGTGTGGGGEPSGAGQADGEDPTATQDRTPPAVGVPAGYRLVHDPLDFTVAVPAGWERRLDGSTRVDFVSPDGTRFLRVDQRAEAGSDAEQAWLDLEPSIAASLSGYSRIRIEPVDYRGWEAADWEFTWEGESGTVHVLNRGFITDPRGFALYVSGPDESWEDESLPVFEAAAGTFEPSS